MSNKLDLIYIAGYGRSGSTLLGSLLHCQPLIHACGEMASFFNIYSSHSRLCSCGKTLDKCEFWNVVAEGLFQQGFLLEEFPYYSRIQKKREAHWSHGGSFAPTRYHGRYANLMRPFFDALAQHIQEKQVLVDSSKTAYTNPLRPIAISQLAKFRVRVIHLVRDPRGVAWSVKRGLNRRLEAGRQKKSLLPLSRAISGWIFANRAACKLKSYFGEKNYFLVKYEDLVEKPDKVLENIANIWNLNLQKSMQVAKQARNGSEFQVPTMHQLAGNRMRFSKTFSILPDYTWKEKLNSKTNTIVKISTRNLMKKYGYV